MGAAKQHCQQMCPYVVDGVFGALGVRGAPVEVQLREGKFSWQTSTPDLDGMQQHTSDCITRCFRALLLY